MIRHIKEGEISWLAGLQPSCLPVGLPDGIRLHVRRDEIGIEVQGLVGALPLLNGDTLRITPKIGQVNFLRLLFKAEGFQPDLEREYEGFVEYSVEELENLDVVVARQVLFSAIEIMKRSPQQGRIKTHREGLFAVGRVDALTTALNLACRKQEPVAYVVKDKTLNTPENRVLSEAIDRAWFALGEKEKKDFSWIRDRWLRRFPKSEDLSSDLECVEQNFASGRYGGSRDYYRRALMLAQIILGCCGLGFDEAATVYGDAILLNTPNIFEKYLRNTISQFYTKNGYLISKGGVGSPSLYTDGSFELLPDIVVSKDGKPLLIADAKYKRPTAGDHYQMQTYLTANGIKRGLIIAPNYDSHEVKVREFSTRDKSIVREIYLPMERLDLTEDFLSTLVQRFS